MKELLLISTMIIIATMITITTTVFAQETEIIEEIDNDLDERFTPNPPLPLDHPLRFVEDIVESVEFALAPPEEKALIKLKHAEKRILELERAILEGKPELITQIQQKYSDDLEQAGEENRRPENRTIENDDRIREARIKNKIAEKLEAHKDYFGRDRALLVLDAVRQDHIQRNIPIQGIEQAITSVSNNLERAVDEQQTDARNEAESRINQILTDIQTDRDVESRIPDVTKERILQQTRTDIEMVQQVKPKIERSVTTIEGIMRVDDIDTIQRDQTTRPSENVNEQVRERAVLFGLIQ